MHVELDGFGLLLVLEVVIPQEVIDLIHDGGSRRASLGESRHLGSPTSRASAPEHTLRDLNPCTLYLNVSQYQHRTLTLTTEIPLELRTSSLVFLMYFLLLVRRV